MLITILVMIKPTAPLTQFAPFRLIPGWKYASRSGSYHVGQGSAWWAVLAPAKTPPDILKRMNDALNSALKTPEIAKKLDQQGISVIGGSPEVAKVFIEKQMDIWAKVVKDNGIKAD
jgi:hypothetical protein